MTTLIKYHKARNLINEGDVLLFRSEPRKHWYSLPSAGWFVSKFTGGPYSHVGLASWRNSQLLCVEFREWYGGRSISLANYAKQKKGLIDIYRPVPKITISEPAEIEGGGYVNRVQTIRFTQEVASKITTEMYDLTGLPYGWSIILHIAKAYLPVSRLFVSEDKKKLVDMNNKNYVCSTSVAYLFRKYYLDPVPGIPDSYTTPNDLANSCLFTYQFTIDTDE